MQPKTENRTERQQSPTTRRSVGGGEEATTACNCNSEGTNQPPQPLNNGDVGNSSFFIILVLYLIYLQVEASRDMLMSRSLRSCQGAVQCNGNVVAKLPWRSLTNVSIPDFRRGMEKEIDALPEIKARNDLLSFLRASSSTGFSPSPFNHVPPEPPTDGYRHVMSPHQIRTTLDAAIATFHLHVESRIASLCGQGFYTIGPW